MKKVAATILAGVFMVFSVTSAAFAVTQYPPEGGVWNWGRDHSTVWSYYRNSTPQHATSTVGRSGLKRSPCAARNQWARMSDKAAWWGGNKAYYRNTCP